MANLNGGYVMINLADTSNLYNLALKAIDANKPIMVYGDDIPYIADSVTADGSSVTITKGGQVITISDANVITKTGYKDNMLLSQIVDDDGNARFIEGDGETQTLTGFTYSYNKWTLNGRILNIVVCGEIANGTTIGGSTQVLCTYTLPSYIFDKIIGVMGSGLDVVTTDKLILANDTTWYYDPSVPLLLRKKDTYIDIAIPTSASASITDDYQFRISFDLVIDTE